MENVSAQKLGSASFEAIDALSSVSLGWLNWETKRYEPSDSLHTRVDLLSLIGDIALKCGTPQVHVHALAGECGGVTEDVKRALETLTSDSVHHGIAEELRCAEDAAVPCSCRLITMSLERRAIHRGLCSRDSSQTVTRVVHPRLAHTGDRTDQMSSFSKQEPVMSILSDVKEIQAKVRKSMQDGPVTPYYTLPLDKVYDMLNAALASEIICVLRYKQHYYMTTSIHQEQLQGLFKEHWQDEEIHLERIADRIKQLGGVPNLDPNGISKRAFSTFESGHTLADLLREDLLAERVVIKIYGDIVKFFGDSDPVSRRMFEEILKDEEDHADEIADLLYTVDPKTGKTVEQFTGDSVSKRFKG